MNSLGVLKRFCGMSRATYRTQIYCYWQPDLGNLGKIIALFNLVLLYADTLSALMKAHCG